MRVSRFYLATLKEAPAEAEVMSQKLMLRAGMIKKVSSGIYTWMPLGLITLRKVEAVVREEMNRAGAVEVYMPHVVPAELWQETGRWDKFGPQLLKIYEHSTLKPLIYDTFAAQEEVPASFSAAEMRRREELGLDDRFSS